MADVQMYRFNGSSWVEINPKPAGHTHAIADVSGLQTALNGKVNHTVTVSNNVDLDTIKTSGFYRLSGTHPNMPSGGAYGQLIVSRGGDTTSQIIISYASGNMWFRGMSDGGSWYAWRTVWHNVNLNPNNFVLNNDSRLTDARPASDVYSWAKASKKPSYNLGEISDTETYKRVTQSEKNIWNAKQDEIGYIPENIANKRTSIRTTGANDSSYVTELGIKNYVDGIAATKQNVLGFTPVPNTRTIAGLDLTQNRSRDAIIGVNANGYVRRTGTNTYDVRTVDNLKTDLGLGSAAYVTLNSSNRFVTDSQIESWNNKFDKPSGTSSQYVTGNGSLATFPTVPTKLSHLSDVSSLVTPSNGQILTYNGLSWGPSNKPSYNLGEISDTETYKRVTQAEKDNWNNKWKLIYSGPSSQLSETSTTSVSVPSDIYTGKTIAVEFRINSSSGTLYQRFVAIATVGTSSVTSGSKIYPRYLTISEWDGSYLKFISTKCYASSTSAVSSLMFGQLRTLVGQFSGTTINWTTQANDDLSVYIGKIWVIE